MRVGWPSTAVILPTADNHLLLFLGLFFLLFLCVTGGIKLRTNWQQSVHTHTQSIPNRQESFFFLGETPHPRPFADDDDTIDWYWYVDDDSPSAHRRDKLFLFGGLVFLGTPPSFVSSAHLGSKKKRLLPRIGKTNSAHGLSPSDNVSLFLGSWWLFLVAG